MKRTLKVLEMILPILIAIVITIFGTGTAISFYNHPPFYSVFLFSTLPMLSVAVAMIYFTIRDRVSGWYLSLAGIIAAYAIYGFSRYLTSDIGIEWNIIVFIFLCFSCCFFYAGWKNKSPQTEWKLFYVILLKAFEIILPIFIAIAVAMIGTISAIKTMDSNHSVFLFFTLPMLSVAVVMIYFAVRGSVSGGYLSSAGIMAACSINNLSRCLNDYYCGAGLGMFGFIFLCFSCCFFYVGWKNKSRMMSKK
jgi:signal transduction histidine kinase